jgi:hypothetical protein
MKRICTIAAVLATLINFLNLVTTFGAYMYPPRRDVMFQYHVRCLDPTSVRFW